MFCPKYGSLLLPKKEGGKVVVVCRQGGKIVATCKVCGYKNEQGEQIKIKDEKATEEKAVEVIDEAELQTLPLTDAECPKCGHGKAHYWLVQTRAADEPETKFLKCEKCTHTWRDYN